MVGGLERKQQDRVAGLVGAADERFGGIEQATVRRVEPGLRDRAGRVDRAAEVGEASRRRGAEGGPVLQAHPGLGDDPEDPFRPEQHAVG